MSGQIEQSPLIRQKSTDTWICCKCSFENLQLLHQCQICDSPKPKSENDLKKQQDKASQGFRCYSCNNFDLILKTKCQKCGVILIPQDSQEQQQSTKKTQKKVDKPSLVTCYACSFQNDPLNERCVACQNNLKVFGLFPTYTKAAPFKKKSIKYNQTACIYCSMTVRKLYMSNHLKCCPGRINSTQGYQSVKRTYCLFCYQKFDASDAKSHDDTCSQRKQFFEVKDNATYQRMSKLQIDTIQYMHKKSQKMHWLSQKHLVNRIQKLGYKASDLQNLHHYIVNYAPIIIHMHANNHMQFFVKDTHYRNQFQTRKSSGSLSSSARTQWEDRMFDRRHHDASPFQRVKYGTINFTNDPQGVGVCSGYGQSYFLLKPHVRNRCTVTDMDSSSPSASIGTFQFFYHVFNKVSDGQIKAAFEGSKGKEVGSDCIGTYKQIQIHGPVQFKKDIQRVYISKHQLLDPKIQKMVQQFCKNNELQYQIFQKLGMGMPGGMFGSSYFPTIPPAPPVHLKHKKPKKTKSTAHLFGGGSARSYLASRPPIALPQPVLPPQPPARIIPDPPKLQEIHRDPKPVRIIPSRIAQQYQEQDDDQYYDQIYGGYDEYDDQFEPPPPGQGGDQIQGVDYI